MHPPPLCAYPVSSSTSRPSIAADPSVLCNKACQFPRINVAESLLTAPRMTLESSPSVTLDKETTGNLASLAAAPAVVVTSLSRHPVEPRSCFLPRMTPKTPRAGARRRRDLASDAHFPGARCKSHRGVFDTLHLPLLLFRRKKRRRDATASNVVTGTMSGEWLNFIHI